MLTKRLTRRDIIKKAVYVSPVILTLPAMLSFGSAGSGGSNPGRSSRHSSGGGFSCNRVFAGERPKSQGARGAR